jgi:hypothetical protein
MLDLTADDCDTIREVLEDSIEQAEETLGEMLRPGNREHEDAAEVAKQRAYIAHLSSIRDRCWVPRS